MIIKIQHITAKSTSKEQTIPNKWSLDWSQFGKHDVFKIIDNSFDWLVSVRFESTVVN